MLVEEPVRLLDEAETGVLAVLPRPDQQPRTGHVEHRRDALSAQLVVPAADHVDRDAGRADLIGVRTGAALRPEPRPHQRGEVVPVRHAAPHLRQRRGLLVLDRRLPQQDLALVAVDGPVREVLLHGAGRAETPLGGDAAGPPRVVLVPGEAPRQHRLEVRRADGERVHRGVAGVGAAVDADVPAGPALRGEPLGDLVGVGGLDAVVVAAAGAERLAVAAPRHLRDDVAVVGELGNRLDAARLRSRAVLRFPVDGQAVLPQHRELARGRGPVHGGSVEADRQPGSVAHRQVEGLRDAVGERRLRPVGAEGRRRVPVGVAGDGDQQQDRRADEGERPAEQRGPSAAGRGRSGHGSSVQRSLVQGIGVAP